MNIIQQSRKIYVFVFDIWRKEVRKAKCSVPTKMIICRYIQGDYGSHLESTRTMEFTIKIAQMLHYLVVWPSAISLRLHFFTGLILIDSRVLTVSQT